MIIKIHTPWHISGIGTFPNLIIKTFNITPAQYAEMHAQSDYKNVKYEIIKSDDNHD